MTMTNPRAVSAAEAPPPAGPYSQVVVAGGLLFLAGQGPFDADGRRVGETIDEQLRQTFDNLEAVARAAGTSLRHAVRYGVYLRDRDDFARLNAIAPEYLGEVLPARTTIQADLRGFDVEIDAVVAVPDRA